MKIVRFMKPAKVKGVCYFPGAVLEVSEYESKRLCAEGICVIHEPLEGEHIFRHKKKPAKKADKD